ncbi:MAG: hypothetical protein V7641_2712 [Blastocatellia bacterium]
MAKILPGTPKLTKYELLEFQLENIAALNPLEYKEKAEKVMFEFLEQTDKQFKNTFKGAKYVKPTEASLNSMAINIEGYSNYRELLEDAQVMNSLFAKTAYSKESGMLHRSIARIALILAITAAEDYVNLKCVYDKKLTKTAVKNKSLMQKWTVLIPDLAHRFPSFSGLIKLRNDKIIHFKAHDKPSLDHITDLNFENAQKAVQTVLEMIKHYEKSPATCIRSLNSARFLADLIKLAEELSQRINGSA